MHNNKEKTRLVALNKAAWREWKESVQPAVRAYCHSAIVEHTNCTVIDQHGTVHTKVGREPAVRSGLCSQNLPR